jgi:hypothetical protein
MVGGDAETHERDVGPFAGGDRCDFSDIDLAGDHVVPEPGDDLFEQGEPVAPLIRDQNT